MTYNPSASVVQVAGKAYTKQFVSAVLTGTGSQQTIAHGLGRTPDQVELAVLVASAGFSVLQTAAPDATNIYVTATSTVEYQVKATSTPRGLQASGVN